MTSLLPAPLLSKYRHWLSPEGDVVLVLGDCLSVLGEMEAGMVDACVTDPPYGINHARDRKSQEHGWNDYPASGWDLKRPDKPAFDAILSMGVPTCIWGGNYFTDFLPPSSKWLIWDKGQTDFSLADCETGPAIPFLHPVAFGATSSVARGATNRTPTDRAAWLCLQSRNTTPSEIHLPCRGCLEKSR